MAESDGDAGVGEDRTEFRLDEALARFKAPGRDADTTRVSDDGRAGMTWNPVTDVGTGGRTDTQPRSSFQFDLGSALARLGNVSMPSPDGEDEDVEAPDADAADPLPLRGRYAEAPPAAAPVEAADQLPTRTPPGPSTEPDPLPTRGPATAAREGEPLSTRTPPGPSTEPETLPTRAPTTGRHDPDPLPTRTPPDANGAGSPTRPVVDRLPTRTSRAEAPSPPAESSAAPPLAPIVGEPLSARDRRSVFDDANPMPTLPSVATSVAPQVTMPAPASAPAGDAPFVPTLPTAPPAAPPSMAAPIASAPSTPELNALRSAQLRANRNDRHGKLFGRSLLGLIVVGGMVAAALLFGRSYLFPTEWSTETTPLVDEIQSARGIEFDHTLALVERPASEYAPLVTAHVLGGDWSTRLPEWRALGIAGGDGSVADVQMRIADLYPVFYDAEADELVASADRSADARQAALRLALEVALARQLADGPAADAPPLGLTGLDPIETVARRSYDAAAVDLVEHAPDAVADLAGVPLPVAYQLRAADGLGTALIAEVTSPRPADPLPAAVSRLADGATEGLGALLQPGDQQVLEPVALGTDDWVMIWGARLAPSTVGRMADSLESDSYTVVNRSGVTCFVAVFETATDADGATLMADLTGWAAGAPEPARAMAAQLGPDRVQLEACDPGADAAAAPAVGAVDLVLSRQLGRLSAG